jgi:type II secretory pathway pseudopilin PulG
MASHDAGGFTLLEVVLAVALIVAMCAGVAMLFVASARSVAGARAATLANLLVRDKIEQLRALAIDDPALIAVGIDTLREDVDGYNDVPVPGWRRRWSVAALPGYPALGIVVQVNVVAAEGRVVAGAVTIRSREAM